MIRMIPCPGLMLSTSSLKDTTRRRSGILMERHTSQALMPIMFCRCVLHQVAANKDNSCGCSPGIQQTEANLNTGEVKEWITIWNGTGGLVSLLLVLSSTSSC
jgi:hypothetical protein